MKTKVETANAPLPKTSPHSQAIVANGLFLPRAVSA